MSELQGTVLGKRYEIQEKLGGGGMSTVYLGKDIVLNRLVTIKILHEQFAYDEEFVKRFQREAQAVASLSHPNIVSLYDVGHQGHFHYLIMEYVEGRTLKELIRERAPINPKEAIYFAQQICDALSHAHDKGIIHRDIKPHNILVTNNGRIKVTDFGIAKAVSTATLTYSGNMVGSVHYFSPEQAKGAQSDAKSDIYSLGIVLFEMLTGRLPFDGDSPISVAIQHIQNSPPNPADLNPAVSQRLSAIILKALNKDPAKRYSSALEMRWELQQVLDNEMPSSKHNEISQENPTIIMPALELSELESEAEESPQVKRRLKKPVLWGLVGLVVVFSVFFAYRAVMDFLIVPVVKVPNVVGQSYKVAKANLEKDGLLAEYNKIYNDKVPKDYVFSQSPDPGSEVKKGRIITLMISSGPRLAKVPDLINKNRADAESILQNEGFVAQIDEEFNDQVNEGIVFAQSPAAGEQTNEGAIIKLKVSKGGKPKYISMPDLRGMYLDEAKKALVSAGLRLGVTSKEGSTEYFPWQVISQDVEPNTSIQQGTAINLVVSEGPGPTSQTAHVSIPLPNDGIEHKVRIVVIDAKGTHEEYSATHQSGELVEQDVPYFGKGKIQVFIDEVLSFEQPVE